MNVLVLTNHMAGFTGSEIVALEAAQAFAALGCRVLIFCNAMSPLLQEHIRAIPLDIRCNDPIPDPSDFDIVWSQHYVLPLLLAPYLPDSGRHRPYFVFVHLSPYEPHEGPLPLEDVLADQILANSAETRDALGHFGFEGARITLFPNPAPRSFHVARSNRSPCLSRLTVISNHLPPELSDAMGLLRGAGIMIRHIGLGGEEKRVDVADITGADALVTIGKSTQYALLSRTPVYTYDIHGGPGWLHLNNFQTAGYYNFSGRCCNRRLSASELAQELITGYPAASSWAEQLSDADLDCFHLEPYIMHIVRQASEARTWSSDHSHVFSGRRHDILSLSKMAAVIRQESAQRVRLAQLLQHTHTGNGVPPSHLADTPGTHRHLQETDVHGGPSNRLGPMSLAQRPHPGSNRPHRSLLGLPTDPVPELSRPYEKFATIVTCFHCRGALCYEGEAFSCERCGARFLITAGLLQSAPTDHLLSQTPSRYSAEEYEHLFNLNDQWSRWITQRTRDIVGRYVTLPVDVMLELGCGTGVHTRGFVVANIARHILATDISLDMLEQAAKRSRCSHVLHLLQDAQALDIRDESVDLVVGGSVLHHVLNLERCLREMCRVLRPGGVAAFFEPFYVGNRMIAFVLEFMLHYLQLTDAYPPEKMRRLEETIQSYVRTIEYRRDNRNNPEQLALLDDKHLFVRSEFYDSAIRSGFHGVYFLSPYAGEAAGPLVIRDIAIDIMRLLQKEAGVEELRLELEDIPFLRPFARVYQTHFVCDYSPQEFIVLIKES